MHGLEFFFIFRIATFIVFLATSTVFSDVKTCSEAQKLIMRGQIAYEDFRYVKGKYFEYQVDYLRGSTKETENVFYVLKSVEGNPLPSVYVGGSSYEILDLAVVPLVLDGSAVALQLTFVNNAKEYTCLVVPLIGSNNTKKISAALNMDLVGLDNVAKDDIYTASLRWLEPLLKRVHKMNKEIQIVDSLSVQMYHNIFLTECKFVSYDVLQPFFESMKDTAAETVVYYPVSEETE